jgi:predicted nucleic acid-binding protein
MPRCWRRLNKIRASLAKAEGELELFSFILRSYRGLRIVPIPADSGPDLFPKMLEEKFLPRDALHLLTMEAHGVRHIATSDPNFERAKGIAVWKP